MRFCERVKKIMEQKGIGQNELARKANLSSSGISYVLNESGNPRESTMIAIYKALGLTPSAFWSEEISLESLSRKQMDLITLFDQLNDSGKKFVMDQAEYAIHQEIFRQDASAQSAI